MAYAVRLKKGDVIDYTPNSAVAAGDIVPMTGMCAVAEVPIAADQLGSLTVRGVFSVAKVSGTVFTAGDKVYWNATNHNLTKTNTDTYFGVCVESAVSAATVATVLLTPAGA